MPEMDTTNASPKNANAPQDGTDAVAQRHFAYLWAMIDAHKKGNRPGLDFF